jgi:IS30 family transposase
MPAYSHLLDEERDQIAIMRAAGHSICAIAGALQRAKSTVSRELRRNALPSGRYSPLHAAGAYQLRRRREAILQAPHKRKPRQMTGAVSQMRAMSPECRTL